MFLCLVSAGIWYVTRGGPGRTSARIRTLAVLPLENLSGDASQEYFTDGMTDALIADLSQIRSLRVISRTSIMRFKGSRQSLPQIADALGADAVVEGSVVRSGDRVRVTAQLVSAATDAAVWSRNYEREMSDLLRLQSEIAQSIAVEIRAEISTNEQKRLGAANKLDPRASEEYLLGQYHLQRLNESDLALATGHFSRVIEIEPQYAGGYAGLARAWFERGIWGDVGYSRSQAPATEAAKKALELDPDLSAAHTAMVFIHTNYDYDWTAAETHAKRAIDLDPSNSDAYLAYSWQLLVFGRFDEMKQYMAIAEGLDPVSSRLESDYGRMLYRARVFDEAERHLKRAIELDPTAFSVYGRLADLYTEMGRFDDAIAYNQKAKQAATGSRDYDLRLAYTYARMGDRQKAMKQLNNARFKNLGDEARMYTALDDFDKAFELLDRGLTERQAVLPHIRVEPSLDKLHSDPRWPKLLARMNLPPS